MFLGAGASTEFGIPSIREMTRLFVKEYPHHKSRIDKIRRDLRRVGFFVNIENFLSYARGQVKPKQTLLNSSPFVCSLIQNKKLGYDPKARKLINDIEEFIARKCCILDYWSLCIKKHYERFLKRLQKRFRNVEQINDIDIFTTNYDNVIEKFGSAMGIDVFWGYEPMGDGTYRFAPELYDSRGSIRLYKLHGSVTLGIILNERTGELAFTYSQSGLKVGARYKDSYGRKWKVVERVMIHGYEKDPSREPYFDLLYRLKEKLKAVSAVIVVGYSFSDSSILQIFCDVLNSRSDLKLIILNTRAKRIKKSLFNNSRNIRAINAPFSNFSRI